MRAVVRYAGDEKGCVRLEERDIPKPARDEVLLRVIACGVCRTDLHIVDGELAPHHDSIVPGHQIVGEVVECGPDTNPASQGSRGGVTWLGSVDGTCWFCRHDRENLCDAPVFT